MSSNPSTLPPTGLSKSAAKKRAKKAAKAQAANPSSIDISGEVETTGNQPPSVAPPLPPSSAPDPLDPSLFNFSAPGSYPVDVQYDNNAYYDEVDVPINHQNAFAGSYSIDYNLSLQNGGALAGLSAPFNITHDDLISAANELYKRMADPEFGADDAYWSSLPPHIRQFIRDAVPFTGTISQNTPGNTSSQRTMYQMAQQIVQAASQGMGLGQGMGANLMSGVNGMNGRQYAQPSIGEELGFHRHPDAKEEEYEDEEDYDGDEQEYIAPNGDAPKKKNKKKKKKNHAAAVEPPPTSLPPPTAKQPPRQPVPPQPPVQQQQQPALNPPPPPVTPAPAHPPPSSRAAGKQPMSNTAVPAANPPARSARAAGKAPASAAPPHNAHAGHTHNHPPASSKPVAKGKAPAAAPPAKIWTQSSAEDRENIRLFWLGLSEAERRDLLRIEKDAVLRKMKEQHRHSCGCAVCGRKKVNIEMELDQLYEQYYDELRSYAAEQRAAANGVKPPPNGAGPFPGSVEVDATGVVTRYDHRAPDPHVHDHDDLDGDESDEYDDEEDYGDEDELDDEDIGSDEADVGDDLDETAQPPPPVSNRHARPPPTKTVTPRPEGGDDFLSFGANLATIKGGILTIADDMLKNDGSKFLEMMEQLAIRRSAREEQNLRELQEETDDEDDESKE
ncbi:stress response protein NST1 [Kwoniella shandongensis]|uniref:Stress response protein NST1 n=1 Tax=Kwoniella shandongensis TaxID=1734106 RepID=A0AAJ8LNU1_9TREE